MELRRRTGNELRFSMSEMVGVVHGFWLDSCDGKVRRVMSILQHDSTLRLASLDGKFVLSVKIYRRRLYIDHGYYISASNAKALLNNFNIYEREIMLQLNDSLGTRTHGRAVDRCGGRSDLRHGGHHSGLKMDVGIVLQSVVLGALWAWVLEM
jgi:hypothetical protein